MMTIKLQNIEKIQKYYNYNITILNFKTISDKNIIITINIIILCSPNGITVKFY